MIEVEVRHGKLTEIGFSTLRPEIELQTPVPKALPIAFVTLRMSEAQIFVTWTIAYLKNVCPAFG